MKDAMPFLRHTAENYGATFDFEAEELLQVALEESLRIESGYDPGSKAKFTTYLWLPITGAMIDRMKRDRRDGALFDALARGLAEAGPGALFRDDDTQLDLFDAKDEELAEQFSSLKTKLMGSMFISLFEVHPDPETQYLDAEQRALAVAAIGSVLEEFDDSDRALIDRAVIEQQPLTEVLATTPPWDVRGYVAGRRHFLRLKQEIGEALREHGINSQAAREMLARARK